LKPEAPGSYKFIYSWRGQAVVGPLSSQCNFPLPMVTRIVQHELCAAWIIS
jgi:hypothetical protein